MRISSSRRGSPLPRTARAVEWPLPLTGPSAAASRGREAFTEALRLDVPVLIAADAGLDADAVARALHDRSRPGMPFVVIDCAGADPASIERDLLGEPQRGDAHHDVDRVGPSAALLRARAGTLYLRHIGDLPAGVQRRLARVMRDREVSVGRRRAALRARVVTQASASIATDVRDGHVRPDLLRRLSHVTIAVPVLRERAEDIPELAVRVAAALRSGDAPVFTQAALTVLAARSWMGNLDELRAVLERILASASNGTVRQEDVLAHLPIDGALPRVAPQVSLREARRQFERDYIASVLERHRWRMSDAARTLGIERANLYRKTRQLGIARRGGAAAS